MINSEELLVFHKNGSLQVMFIGGNMLLPNILWYYIKSTAIVHIIPFIKSRNSTKLLMPMGQGHATKFTI